MVCHAYTRCRVSATISLIFSCLILQVITTQGFRFVSISHEWGSHLIPLHPSLISDEKSLVSPGSVYGLCSSFVIGRSEYCIFYLETNSKITSDKHVRRCRFDLNNHDNTEYTEKKVVAIDKDKALLISYTLRFELVALDVLHFSDCTVKSVHIPKDEVLNVDINKNLVENIVLEVNQIGAVTNDTFDVYFEARSSFSKKHYQGTLDFDGNIITLRELDLKHDYDDQDGVIHSPSKGRLMISRYTFHYSIYADDDKGPRKLIKLYPIHDQSISASSITNQLLSVCTGDVVSIECEQFDSNGNLKFESSVHAPFDYFQSKYIHTMKTFNLPGGGLLLLIAKCGPKSSRDDCTTPPAKNIFVTKIDADGALVGTFQLHKFPTESWKDIPEDEPYPTFHFFENEEREMCLSLLNESGGQHHNITLNIVCFKDEDLYKTKI